MYFLENTGLTFSHRSIVFALQHSFVAAPARAFPPQNYYGRALRTAFFLPLVANFIRIGRKKTDATLHQNWIFHSY